MADEEKRPIVTLAFTRLATADDVDDALAAARRVGLEIDARVIFPMANSDLQVYGPLPKRGDLE